MHDKFVDRLSEQAQKIPMGDPLDEKTQLGPLMTKQRVEDISKIAKLIQIKSKTIAIIADRIVIVANWLIERNSEKRRGISVTTITRVVLTIA